MNNCEAFFRRLFCLEKKTDVAHSIHFEIFYWEENRLISTSWKVVRFREWPRIDTGVSWRTNADAYLLKILEDLGVLSGFFDQLRELNVQRVTLGLLFLLPTFDFRSVELHTLDDAFQLLEKMLLATVGDDRSANKHADGRYSRQSAAPTVDNLR